MTGKAFLVTLVLFAGASLSACSSDGCESDGTEQKGNGIVTLEVDYPAAADVGAASPIVRYEGTADDRPFACQFSFPSDKHEEPLGDCSGDVELNTYPSFAELRLVGRPEKIVVSKFVDSEPLPVWTREFAPNYGGGCAAETYFWLR